MAQLNGPTLRAIRRYGRQVDQIAAQYGISGTALLAKLVQGESGGDMKAISPAGARGIAQFMPGTRQAAISKYGIDPWADEDQAVHAAELHLRGKLTGNPGLKGYNPGSPTYTNYILGQKVGNVVGPAASKARSRVNADERSGQAGTPATPGVDNAPVRRQLIQNFLQTGGVANSNAVLTLASEFPKARDIPAQAATTASPEHPSPKQSGGAVDTLKFKLAADAINSAKLPYKWGGGHGGKVNPNKPIPFDCSGAVSSVLGINPRVASQFESFGKPGDGGNSGVTIYANDKHVFMKIDGHFFGTSRTNPGGGAGWIPQGAISKQYLSGFTARHL